MKVPLLLTVSVLLLSLLPWALSAQESSPDFSSIENNLEQLESLIEDTLNTNETLTKQLADLNLILNEKELLIDEQEALLTELQTQLNGMSETYKTLSSLYAPLGRLPIGMDLLCVLSDARRHQRNTKPAQSSGGLLP
jgi:septal ring factor EnvC (AmiA/AmiB activator)